MKTPEFDPVDMFRRRARHATREAEGASDPQVRDVLNAVAFAWQEIALDAARMRRRAARGANPQVVRTPSVPELA